MTYVPTKPRGPIAAMYTSPGPCYGLPNLTGLKAHDPRSVHRKLPAFSFGVKYCKLFNDGSPGPCYLPDAKISRTGKDGTPHFSLQSRSRDPTIDVTPGPGSYKPESAGPSSKVKHPAFSLGSRLKYRRSDCTPAANTYTLPNMTGRTVLSGKRQAPSFSLPGRQKTGGFADDTSHTPGPGAYGITDPSVIRTRYPIFSMTARSALPGDKTQKPGPGSHSPQNFWAHKQKNPQFSFGIRHSPYTAPLILDVQD